ncbi:MAG: helix-turn-helix domain-containing protein [Dehalococcoidia bacterium]|nr:helix-turn-helix domain-containing protein [Dehalococcoidia bacterium]
MAKIKEFRGLVYAKYDSEAAFARDLGWQKQRLNKISNGIKEPDLLEASIMAKYLGVELDYLVSIFLRKKLPVQATSN